MNCISKLTLTFALILCLLGGLPGCQVYHNTAARFNAYFLAKEKMLEVEQELFGKMTNDYNNVLQVLTPLDTMAAQAQKSNLEYCVKMASRPIQFHKTSKWVDDCYIVIGKSRLYQGQFKEAITTFKYVNTESQDPDARHQALTWLMRTYIEARDFKNVEFIANYLSKETAPIRNETVRQFYITMAHYYRLQNDYPRTLAYLEQALPFIKDKELMRRSLYIMAQIHQKQGNDARAYEYYTTLLRRNPGYEMMFQAQLNASRAASLEDATAAGRTEKQLKTLLNDEKNTEYKDKIYYELALFELKRNRPDDAIGYLKKSVAMQQASPAQKAYSLIQLGRIYDERKNDPEQASRFYTAAMQIMSPDMERYQEVSARVNTLAKITAPYREVQEADRLIRLSKLSEAALDKELEEEIAREKETVDAAEKENQEMAALNATSGTTPVNGFTTGNPAQGNWLFYNQATLDAGRASFLRDWGNRPLEDHWRRSRKAAFGNPGAGSGNDGNAPKPDSTAQQPQSKDKYASVASKEARIKQIPRSAAAITQQEERLQEGLLGLGKVYYEELQQYDKAAASLKRLVSEFPKNESVPEALYLLQKICQEGKNCDPQPFQQQLRQQFPTSVYAKLLDNKNFLQEMAASDQAVSKIYEASYLLYQQGKYSEAGAEIEELLKTYPNNTYMDKVQLLRVMILVKTSTDKDLIEDKLRNFMNDYSTSNLVPFAQRLLDNLRK